MIEFENVRYKNFLSSGNYFTEIPLNSSSSTLIVGKNGNGKSTVIDAITFGLFGKAFRKINKPALINSINQGNCVVEVDFKIGNKKYKIVRGMKPNIFEIFCNSVLVNQDAKTKDYQELLEKNILRLNYKSFTQVVILGSASFTPFMQLSASDRRAVIEDLLDIQIFSTMNTLVKDKLFLLKEEVKTIKYEIELTKEKIELQKHNIEEHKQNTQEIIKKKINEIQESQSQISDYQKSVSLIQKHIDILNLKITDELTIKSKKEKTKTYINKLKDSHEKNNKIIQFYDINDSCPTCKQVINSDFKNEQIDSKKNKNIELEEGLKQLQENYEELSSKISIIEEIKKKIYEHNSEIVRINSSVVAIEKYIKKINNEIEELSKTHDNLDNDNTRLKTLVSDLIVLNDTHEKLLVDKKYYDFCAALLKDGGIKTKIIKQYLPIMNKLINKYLTDLDFFVNFNINENFEESIKSRHRDDFTYSNFSEGEKQKIDISLLFAWRQIARIRNSVNTNLLIMDEVFDSSLDANSTELLINLLQQFNKNTNLFVISHKNDQLIEKFETVISFEKVKNFSKMKVIS